MGLIRAAIEELEDSPIVDVWRMGYGNPEVIGMFAGESDVPTAVVHLRCRQQGAG